MEVYHDTTWGYFDNNYDGSYADAIYEQWEEYDGEIGIRCTVNELFDRVDYALIYQVDNNSNCDPEWDTLECVKSAHSALDVGAEECIVICEYDDTYEDYGEWVTSKVARIIIE